jgi:hypothetical protein
MSRIPPDVPASPGGEPATAFCAATYYANRRGEDAFTFRVPATSTWFTIYASRARYEVGQNYALILAAPDAVPVPLSVEDLEFLRHCLTNTAQRWHEAITEASAGAERPPPDPTEPEPEPERGYLNAEPTPAGYRLAGRLFRDELTRVEQLAALLGEVLAAQTRQEEGS